MRAEDWEQVERNWKAWQEADIHDLRMRFAATMVAILQHRREIVETYGRFSPADVQLWSIPKEEGF